MISFKNQIPTGGYRIFLRLDGCKARLFLYLRLADPLLGVLLLPLDRFTPALLRRLDRLRRLFLLRDRERELDRLWRGLRRLRRFRARRRRDTERRLFAEEQTFRLLRRRLRLREEERLRDRRLTRRGAIFSLL